MNTNFIKQYIFNDDLVNFQLWLPYVDKNNYADLLFTTVNYAAFHIMTYLLVECQVDPNADDGEIIINACIKGNIKILQLLYKAGADFTIRRNAALMYIAYYGKVDVLNFFLENNITDVTFADNNALIVSAMKGQSDFFVKLLTLSGVDVTAQNNKVLISAVGHGHQRIVKLLCHDQRVKCADDSAILWARVNTETRTARYIESYFPDP